MRELELVFILDKSGSMSGLEKETINGYNKIIEEHLNDQDTVYVTTVLFNNDLNVLFDHEQIGKDKLMIGKDYIPNGCTALLDSVGKTIKHIEDVTRYREFDEKERKVIFVIVTDGLENSSTMYSYKQINKLISNKKELGWDFLFLGANIDAEKEAEELGIGREYSATYTASSKKVEKMYNKVNDAVCMMASAKFDDDWKKDID